MIMDWLKKAPTAVVVSIIAVCGVLALAILAVFLVLSLQGVDTTEFRQWINTVGQILVFPLIGTGTVAAVQAARSASKAEDQTNGQLEARDAQIAALRRQVQAQAATIARIQEGRRD